jgi:iron complex outermembrane receptor protein
MREGEIPMSVFRKSLSTLLLLPVAGVSFAQSAPTGGIGSVGLEEIIVTARKRSESLHDVPISITAFTARDIEDAGIENVQDVAQLTPGLTWTALFGSAGGPVIRGVSTNIGEPNVGFFLDGVYQSSRATMDALIGGIERIEIAKGPQSALYGRNTFGGAVNYITKKPGDTQEGEIELTLGDNGRQDIAASVSGPLSDTWSYRAGISYRSFDGYYTNELTGGDLDTKESLLAALSLEANPSDSLNVIFRVGLEDTDNGDFPIQYVRNNAGFVAVPFNDFQVYGGDLPGLTTGFAVTPGSFERQHLNTSLSIIKDFDNLSLTSITGFNDLDIDSNSDNDFEARPLGWQIALTDQQEFSQELRLSGGNERSNWTAGIYYFDLSLDTDVDNRFIDPALDGLFAPPTGPLQFLGIGSAAIVNAESTENLAVFGEYEFLLSDAWRLSVSARWADEKKSLDTFVSNPHTGFVLADLVIEDDWQSFTPKVSLSYAMSDATMLYGSVAKAVKAGGFNALVNVTDAERRYDQEDSLNYELGGKFSWADGRATTNVAIFRIDWTDQIVRALGASGAILNINAGETTSQGIELELIAKPTDNLSVRLGYAYTDSQYDDYIFAALATFGLDPDVSGTPLQNVSKNQANASIQYHREVNSNWNWRIRVDSSIRTKQCTIQTCDATVGNAAFTNFRTGLDSDNWSIDLWVNNAFDEDTPLAAAFVQSRGRGVDILGGSGIQFFNALTTAADLRSYGVTARYRF